VLETVGHHVVGADYDAAVVDKQDGKPHVVKRLDHPHIRIIPEWFGGGTLTRKELEEAAQELMADQAGLIVIGSAALEPELDQALAGPAKVVKREIEATMDQINSELKEAFKS
jgi:hypothetical protein